MNTNDVIDFHSSAVNGTTNVDYNTNVYYFTATADIVYTYNLPVITCDGTKFRIYRFDTRNNATLTISATNTINYGGNDVSNFNLNVSSVVTLISFNSIWYVARMGRQGYIIPRVVFSGNYTTNTSSYKVLSGTIGTPVVIGVFSLLDITSVGDYFTGGMFVVDYISGPPTTAISFTITNSSGTLIATVPSTVITGEIILNLGAVIYAPLLAGVSNRYNISYTMQGDNTSSIGLSSFILYSKEWQ